jgi:ornithine cyclodeaminase/alanine dehydrogenase-like protein (mu-crystallin family)
MASASHCSRKAAFEIVKGKREVLFLSEEDVIASIAPDALLRELQDGFRALSDGRVQSPERPAITVPGKGFTLFMPAWREGQPVCVKIVSVFESNLDLGLPNHLAVINLFDPENGSTLCVMGGTHITGLRTAASAVLSVRMLSRKGSKAATIVGAGVQAREHLALLPLVRQFERIFISSLYHEEAEKLAELSPLARPVRSLEKAVDYGLQGNGNRTRRPGRSRHCLSRRPGERTRHPRAVVGRVPAAARLDRLRELACA